MDFQVEALEHKLFFACRITEPNVSEFNVTLYVVTVLELARGILTMTQAIDLGRRVKNGEDLFGGSDTLANVETEAKRLACLLATVHHHK